jgi:hypothetical protein
VSGLEWVNVLASVLVAAPVAMVIAQAIKRDHWSERVNMPLAFVVCAAVALAQSWLAGDVLHIAHAWGSLSATEVVAYVTGVYAVANAEYHLLFAGSSWMLRLRGADTTPTLKQAAARRAKK